MQAFLYLICSAVIANDLEKLCGALMPVAASAMPGGKSCSVLVALSAWARPSRVHVLITVNADGLIVLLHITLFHL